MDALQAYLLLINALGLILMHRDKLQAKKKAWRVPEATLLTVALLGGAAGAMLGMYLFRHKTRKGKFALGLPLLTLVQGLLLYLFCR